MVNIKKELDNIYEILDDVVSGVYSVPSALGPNRLSKTAIKAKTITGTMIDVSNLESVSSKTGNLTVTGNITMTGEEDVALRAGKTAFADTSNAGFWLGLDGVVPKFRIGDTGHTKGMTWDGTDLVINGEIQAETGQIGGWNIEADKLSSDAGSTGLASIGTYRIWVGSSTPSSAPFRVTSGGAMTSTSGSIGGWTIDAVGIRLGSGSSARGMDSGSTFLYAGSDLPSSAPFRVTTAGQLFCTSVDIDGGTINIGSNFSVSSTGNLTAANADITGSITTGDITVTGGTMSIGGNFSVNSSGILTASGVDVTGEINATSGTLSNLTVTGSLTVQSTITVSTSGKIQSGKTSYGSGTGWLMEYNGGSPRFDIGSSSAYLRWNGSSLTMKGRFEWGDHYLDSSVSHFEVNNGGFVAVEFRDGSSSNYSELWSTYDLSPLNKSLGIQTVGTSPNPNIWIQHYNGSGYATLQANTNLYFRSQYVVGDHKLIARLNDTAGSSQYVVENSSGSRLFAIASNGGIITNQLQGSATGGSIIDKFPIRRASDGAIVGYVPVYSS